MSNKAARSTLTPEGWIAAATDVLIDRGIDALRVDRMTASGPWASRTWRRHSRMSFAT